MNQNANTCSWDAEGTYVNYFCSGTYDRRYPCPNHRTLNLVLRYAAHAKDILDYGCGNGRYAIPILQHTASHLSAYDICPVAINQLRQRALESGFQGRIHYLESENDLIEEGGYDLILALFGVLSHICGFENRSRMLKRSFNSLRDDGTFIISVPNAYRRFLFKQIKYGYSRIKGNNPAITCEHGDIFYERTLETKASAFYYHLYTIVRLKSELRSAGFMPSFITAESILPESWVVRSTFYARIDNFLSNLFPAALGYGILMTAVKADKT